MNESAIEARNLMRSVEVEGAISGTYETLHWNDHKVEVVFHGARTRGKYLFQNRHDEDGRDWTLRRLDPADDGPVVEMLFATQGVRRRVESTMEDGEGGGR